MEIIGWAIDRKCDINWGYLIRRNLDSDSAKCMRFIWLRHPLVTVQPMSHPYFMLQSDGDHQIGQHLGCGSTHSREIYYHM